MMDTPQALDQLIQRFTDLFEQRSYPSTPYDPDWPSLCYHHEAKLGEEVPWQPVFSQRRSDMFQRLGNALDVTIHPAIAAYYTRYWSDPLPCRMQDGRLISLLFAWNEQDMERLRANLIGHAMSKQKQKRPLTLFFATLEPDTDYMISLDNQDGSIWLERPGRKPEQQLAQDMAAFLKTLEPVRFSS
ncbi:SecY-interacting protein [Marinobacterium marinum]|nr:SecY-interacting protein [Marinobacterium marinum]